MAAEARTAEGRKAGCGFSLRDRLRSSSGSKERPPEGGPSVNEAAALSWRLSSSCFASISEIGVDVLHVVVVSSRASSRTHHGGGLRTFELGVGKTIMVISEMTVFDFASRDGPGATASNGVRIGDDSQVSPSSLRSSPPVSRTMFMSFSCRPGFG